MELSTIKEEARKNPLTAIAVIVAVIFGLITFIGVIIQLFQVMIQIYGVGDTKNVINMILTLTKLIFVGLISVLALIYILPRIIPIMKFFHNINRYTNSSPKKSDIKTTVREYSMDDFTKEEMMILLTISAWEHDEKGIDRRLAHKDKINNLSKELHLSLIKTTEAVALLLDKDAVIIGHPLTGMSSVRLNPKFAEENKDLYLQIMKIGNSEYASYFSTDNEDWQQ